MTSPDDLVEPEGVNAGSSLAERDRKPDGEVHATDDAVVPPPPSVGESQLAGAPGQTDDVPGQQLEAGEG